MYKTQENPHKLDCIFLMMANSAPAEDFVLFWTLSKKTNVYYCLSLQSMELLSKVLIISLI